MHTRMTRREGAFTLIELLIVVAIIAILAAIAVPNFLEAQTRSKVSRVKSDMRTMATALEAYRVDYNRYVPTHHDASQGDVPAAQAMALTGYSDPHVYDYIDFCGQRLTTPVAYLTSIAHPSPFQIQAAWYRERGFFFVKRAVNPTANSTYYDWWGFRPQNGHQNVPWFLMDGGPDQIWWQNGSVGMYEVTTQYDPSNGTISSGNMWWLGGGGN